MKTTEAFVKNYVKKDIDSIFNILIRAQVGSRLDFQFLLGTGGRITTELVGLTKGHFVILKISAFPAKVDFSSFKASALGIVRLLLEGDDGICVAFRTEVISTITFPSKLIFLKFPTQIQTRGLRNHNRIPLNVPASIKLKKSNSSMSNISGKLIDLSDNGCRFQCDVDKNLTIEIKSNVDLNFTLETGKSVETSGIIKNIKLINNHYHIGIQFAVLGEGASFILNNHKL
jgi:hypothetical protein